MSKTQEEALRRELTELGSVVRTFANKHDGVEQTVRAIEHRQESTDRAIKNLDQKYEGMMNMMAQIMSKLNDKGKEVGDSHSGNGQIIEGVKEKCAGKGGSRLPRMEFPVFDGTNPREWVRRANKYFQIYEVEEEMKTDIAQLYLKDRADIWFHGMYSERGAVPWRELSLAIRERFGEGDPQEAIEEFNKLVQTGSIADYLEKFEMLKSLVMISLPGQPDSYYKSCFLSGLKEEVVNMVRMTKPLTLADAIETAKLQEKNLEAIRKAQSRGIQKTPLPPLSHTTNFSNKMKWPNNQRPDPHTNKSTKLGGPSTNYYKGITPSEFSYRREKGLCFKCAEPYTLGHTCKQAHIHYIMEDESTEPIIPIEGQGEGAEECADCPEGGNLRENIEVSIHALAGGNEHKTIKMRGKLAGRELLVLIDSGSTHCFMDESLAQDLKMQTAGTTLIVKVANGERLESRQLLQEVGWEMQGHNFLHNFNTLKLGSCDLILGVDWLAKHSPIEFDFQQLTMKFLKEKEPVILKGEAEKLKLKAIKGSRLAKWKRKQNYGITAQIYMVEEGGGDQGQIPTEMRELLVQFESIFDEPQGMPPVRSHDHAIQIKEGATPFKNRPYRCPYVQKAEIEKLVKEMLQMGIIQTSNSSFASPVLLVKKKDGSWRFCVDYR
ncbi:uncharacterized protein LOC113774084 [Coffea eugenioides]|uniref:uncharacterized protein LOC113774084 n=1 Tax=Coffea eugenioides TaxID=49369 RepID=UPI000F612BA6|nr:uncharacterized protein LOC113774084 [Coffea eugenioides]